MGVHVCFETTAYRIYIRVNVSHFIPRAQQYSAPLAHQVTDTTTEVLKIMVNLHCGQLYLLATMLNTLHALFYLKSPTLSLPLIDKPHSLLNFPKVIWQGYSRTQVCLTLEYVCLTITPLLQKSLPNTEAIVDGSVSI